MNTFFCINKVAVDCKMKVVAWRCPDIYAKIDLRNCGLNNLSYDILIKDKLVSCFLNKGCMRSRNYSNGLLIKSITKCLKLLTLNNSEREISYNNKIKKSCLNSLFINYFSKDFIVEIVVFKP